MNRKHLLLLALASATLYSCGTIAGPASVSKPSIKLPLQQKDGILIAAHRGAWRNFPENSVPGIAGAAGDGAEIIEIDLKRTKDGHLVLMHDATVNRTTDGKGNIEDMTLAEVKQLRLRPGQGNGAAPTGLKVPTFEEVLEAVKGKNVLLNLDKGWDYRDQVIDTLKKLDMVNYALFKGAPSLQEAADFVAKNPKAQYMHIINDANAGDLQNMTGFIPNAVEVAFDSKDDVQAQPAYLKEVASKTDLWVNSMYNSVSGGYTDEAALRDPKLGWQHFADVNARVIQTDNVVTLNAWRKGIDVTKLGIQPGTSIRIQAEDFIDDPALYKDDNKNECGARAIRNPSSPVDACDLDGAYIMQYIRTGDFFTLQADVPVAGSYELTLRHSSDTDPGGTVAVSVNGGQASETFLPNQTHNRRFTVTSLGRFNFKQGSNTIKLSFTHPDYLNVDWIQLDAGTFNDQGLLK